MESGTAYGKIQFVYSPGDTSARLEDRLIPQEDPEAKRLVELLRERRRRRLGEEPKREFPPLPPTNNGRPWTLADCLRARREHIRQLGAAQ